VRKFKWRKVSEREPTDGNLLLYDSTSDSGYYMVTYLPPRRGDSIGDWEFEDGSVVRVKSSQRWLDMDELMTADAVDGKVEFVVRKKK